ncbi:MAG: hypothetical protein JO100_02705 [Pseudonocardia sp.]|nr:hypothetical protein [Pseudonocardia sp.]
MSAPGTVEGGAPDLVAGVPETSPFEGAGVFSNAVDVIEAMLAAQPSSTEVLAADGGLLMGLAKYAFENPLELLASAGVGWLIEHLWFLREPLDALAGDPNQLVAHARTWHNVSARMAELVDKNAGDVKHLAGWRGAASDGYRGAALDHLRGLATVSTAGNDLARHIVDAGTIIATARATIRDLIANLVGELISWAVSALASATATAGASLAAFAAEAVVAGLRLTSEIAALVSKLLGRLSEIAANFARLTGQAGELLSAHLAGTTVRSGLSRGVAIEAAKQSTKSAREWSEWTSFPAG